MAVTHPAAPFDDPFESNFAPAKDETHEQRAARLELEAQAKKVSDAIDDEINKARARAKKKPIKLLLLGQSESGKSTTIKNFQLLYATREFREERQSWKSVIFLNIVQSILLILDAISESQRPTSPRPMSSPRSRNQTRPVPELSESHNALRERLERLRQVEATLLDRLASNGETEATKRSEFAVLASSKWKSAVAFMRGGRESLDSSESMSVRERAISKEKEAIEEVANVLISFRADMEQLWNDPVIRSLPSVSKLRLEEKPGFFLDCLSRVAVPGYVPSDDDVLKARLKTLGVSEYYFTLDHRYPVQTDWRIFDVGGSRSQREYWVPYFDDVDAIIFLVPLSCFDQTLAEDPDTNRLEDCIMLWQQVCSNKMLAKCPLILFFNKRDILERKLKNGVEFKKYVKSFEGEKNNVESITRYLRRKFEANHREYSNSPRPFYCYVTSMTDSKSSSGILSSVTDMVVRQNLQKIALI